MSPYDGGARHLSVEDRAALCRLSFEVFAAAAFAALYPGKVFQPAPYLSLLCGKLQALVEGEGQNLIVTLPPRGLKSFLVSVALPAWLLGRSPGNQVMAVSYAQSLADSHGRERVKLMRSPFYTSVFGEVLTPGGSARRATTVGRGGIFATGIDGSATGMGADYLVFDDPHNAQNALSEQVRTSSNRQFEQTFLSRRNDPLTARIIIVMQRLHEEDFVGHALGLPGLDWDVLNLPAIAEEDEEHAYRTAAGERVFRRRAGDPLHPERFPLTYLDEMRATLSEARFATQYQQRPAPAGGGLVKADWFRRYSRADLPLHFDEVIQSWDTASTISEWSDWTVCTTWGRLGQSIYLLHVHRERLLFPDLVRAVRRLAERFEAHVVLIEDHASGTQLLQVLREAGFGKGRAVKPVGDKEMRMTNQTALLESGRVFAPAEADWVQEYLRELLVFPNGKHDDQVDSTSQALAYIGSWLEGRGLFEFTRERALKANPPPDEKQVYWLMRPEHLTHTFRSVRDYRAGPHGTVWMPEYEGFLAVRMGWTKVAEFIPKKT
jgi:predicted phage terminase large subunit-like protein